MDHQRVSAGQRVSRVWAVVLGITSVLIFLGSIPTGFGPVVVGILVTAGALLLRRLPGHSVAGAYLAVLGAVMVAVGSLLVLGLASSVTGVGDAPSPAPSPAPPP